MQARRSLVLAAAGSLVAAVISPLGAPAAPAQPAPSAEALAVDAAASLVASRPAELHAGADDAFVRHGVISSTNGLKYVPYDRTYKGLPVVGGDFVVVTNSTGQVLQTSVSQNSTITLPATKASVTQAQAEATARTTMSTVDGVGSAEQVVYALDAAPALAWKVTVTGRDAEGPSKLDVVVDAATGKVLRKQERVMHGTGTSGWNGPNPVTIATTHTGSNYSLKDPTLTNVSCQDAANNTTFTKTTDTWGNGTQTNRETGCVDVLFAAQTESKMLSQWLGRNGFDGNGGGWPMRVGLNDQNAYYDGSQVQIGKNSAGQWIGSIDVVAHELGHGIDDHTPGGISGAGTQEFVADVFGATTEWFANEPSPYDTPDFLVGETINLVGRGPIRNMYNPSALNHANCYSSSIPNTEVHAAAGPGNHWFYLLSQGTNPSNGQPTSTTCNNTSITGLGVEKAIKIFYNAMLLKTSSSSYLKYRTWTLTAAKNLYPGSCAEFDTVKAAWDAISVPAQSADPTCSATGGVTVSNPGNQSSQVGTAVSLPLSASGGTAPYTWSATGLPAGLSVNGSTISGTPTTAATSNVTVTATDSAGKTGSASFSWTVGSTGGNCSGQKLLNPGFESGTASWTASSGVIGQHSADGQPARTGTWSSWLNGYGSSHTDSLSQSVTIPSGCKASLTFYVHIDTRETGSTVYDKLTVTAGTTTLATLSNTNAASGYALKTFDLSSFAGQTVALKFTGVEDASLQTSFVIDDTAVTLS
ncbi:M4 family metallopeptidase [Lentzea sp. NPDC058450]|uniref:M4 family metallopeptidase n=1 Tax=Lentzea sp. NPDC058450 TaxID=3346505 RepID=UPI0036462328